MSRYVGEKVYLRAIERGDIERGHRWINDWEVRQYEGTYRESIFRHGRHYDGTSSMEAEGE